MPHKTPKNPFATFDPHSDLSRSPSLDWEEAAVDTHSDVEGFAEEARLAPRIGWLHWLIIGACIILGIQLFNLQVIQGSRLKILAEGNRLRIQTILAPRGYIIDSKGEQIARNTASFALVATPIDIPEDGRSELIRKVSSSFGIPVEEIEKQLQDVKAGGVQPVMIKRNLTQQESILFETNAQEFAGFSLSSIPIRDYVKPEIFSHLLGYTGIIAENELSALADQDYGLNDFIGKSGVELSYEKFLRGINGNKQVEVDASGRPIKVLGSVDPEPGNIVQLNIDAGLQEELYKSFVETGSRTKGAAIALNPKTGEVLALVSVPGYNNNLFAPGISSDDYNKLLGDSNLPLFNRAISGTYPPGSTIKVVGGAAALEEHIVTKDTIIHDHGVLVIPNQFNPGISYNFYGWKRDGLGAMDVKQAIAQSSDIYFYTVAGGHPSSQITGMGAEALARHYRDFGMGAPTGIDIQGEKSGIVADPAWKANRFPDDKLQAKWYLGDTYHIAIGQGDMLATPLQVAVWTAVIANNGTLNKPRVVKQVLDQDGKVVFTPLPELLIKKTISDENIKIVQEGMRENVTGAKGSGRQLATLPISAAGKTGTSQFDGSDPSRTHAWYTSYAPYEDPQIVVTVLVEAGGEGHAAAVPIAKKALEWWAKNRMGK